MKKLFIIAILSCNFLNAQSNLFPAKGNIGIGTITPRNKLVVQAGNTNTNILLHSTGNTDERLRADLMLWASEPNLTWTGVGIGNNVKNWNAATSTGGISRISNLRGGSYIRLLDNRMNFNLVSSSGADKSALTLIDNGNVGIGTVNPVQKLTVAGGNIGLDNKGTLAAKNTSGTYENVLYGRWDNNATYLDGGAGGTYLRTANGIVVNQYLSTNGNVGIGTINPAYKLDVIGTIRGREIRVNLNGADFVFEDGYKLMPLYELEKFVKQNKHLPEIAPAKEMQEKGGDIGSLTIQLLQKIEELTLHAIEQNKKLEQQNKKIEILEAKINNK